MDQGWVRCGVELGRGGPTGQQRGERRKQGDGQLRGACWSQRRALACLPGQDKQLAGAAAGLGQLGGPGGGLPGQFPSLSLFLFLSAFLIFCNFVVFLKIPRQLQKSPNCSWPLNGIYPAWNILVWDYLDI